MIKKIDHIGIAVHDIEQAIRNYTNLLQAKVIHDEIVPSQHLRAVFIKLAKQKIELLYPLNSNSPVAKFLEKRGEGVHHIAFRTNDIRKEIQRLKKEGYRLIQDEPILGAYNKWVCFLHPKDAQGVLIELCQPRKN